ncbi:EAL domain-containing protein [Alteromonas sediminis]|uniref:Sensor protein FixL n=1 Tax=Alteromonas sediminis TaxID=2259342 RepID=A0A3N5Y8V4_9ALTE|nr:GGDEF domain-containing phosphodiesterase [Alteromonas sediminis]RPJ67629.1 EAL domain-containing protein [Alteromonas sediminis]
MDLSLYTFEAWLEMLSNAASLEKLALHMSEVVNADQLMFALIERERNKAHTFCYLVDGQVIGDIAYPLSGTPCEALIQEGFCVHNGAVAEAFPKDTLLKEQGIESYVGYPINNEAGERIGLVAALFKQPKKNLDFIELLFTSLSQSVGAEIRALSSAFALEKSLEALTARNLMFNAIHDTIPDGIVTIDAKGNIQSVNRGGLALFGYEENELIGENITILMPAKEAAEHQGHIDNYASSGVPKIIGRGRKLQAIHKSGGVISIYLRVGEVSLNNDRYYLGYIQNITKTVHLENQLKTFSSRHTISKLPNMAVLKQVLSNALSIIQLARKKMYCAAVSIERFERVQQEHGEKTELKVIECIATKLNILVPEGFTLFHVGLNAFYLVGTKALVSCEEATKFEKKVLEIDGVDIDGATIPFLLTIGSFCFDANALSKTLIWALFDEARAVIDGNGEVRGHRLTEKEIECVLLKERVKQVLPSAIASSEFAFVLQSKVDMNSECHSAELLMRWKSPSLGLVSPAVFIPVAEDGPEILALSQLALNKACEIISNVKQKGKDVTIAVNISANFLTHSTFESALLAVTTKYNVEPKRLILEITESALIKDVAFATSLLQKLSLKGFQFSIDDFGTGYSSLAYLQKLSIHEIKIDKSFVMNLESSVTSQSIVKIIIDLSRAINARVVAEGVETNWQAEFLTSHGCDVLQGFFFHKPQDTEKWQAAVNLGEKSTLIV